MPAARLGAQGKTLLARFVQESALTVIPFGDEHWRVTVDAFTRFGKGRHPAGLNFGDCLTYAAARLADEPLLCLGDNFAKTDSGWSRSWGSRSGARCPAAARCSPMAALR